MTTNVYRIFYPFLMGDITYLELFSHILRVPISKEFSPESPSLWASFGIFDHIHIWALKPIQYIFWAKKIT